MKISFGGSYTKNVHPIAPVKHPGDNGARGPNFLGSEAVRSLDLDISIPGLFMSAKLESHSST